MSYTISFAFLTITIFYSIILNIMFFGKKHIETEETIIFSKMVVTNLIGIILEILCIVFLNIYGTKNVLSLIINKIFLEYFLFILYFFSNYVINTSYILGEKKNEKTINYLKLITKIVLAVSIILLLFFKIELFNENGISYSYGPAVNLVYAISAMTSLFCFIHLIINFKTIKHKKNIPIIVFLVLMGVTAIVQQLFPQITLATSVETFVIFLMYFTIENPDLKMLKEMEIARNQAEKANNAKSDFLSSMSHEIRTPLNAIVGLSEDISTYRGQVPFQVIEDTEDIRSASQTLLEIVGNILDINKIESGKLEISNEVYQPKDVIETLAKIDATRIGEKPIDFKMNIAEDLPYELIGDKLHVKQVLNNLLSNAFKYTEKGEVELTVKCINQNDICNMMISVRDTGRGIKAENINKLFTKFERLDIEKNTTTEGTGLGLAITKSLVELMGGKINVESQFGQGSLFVVQIPQKIKTMVNPLTNTQVIKINEIRMAELKNVNYGHKKVLIVDDNKLNIKVARKALSDFDFEIDECYDGLECLEKIKVGNEYDLILMDIMMPNMGGETTITKLKENPNFNIPTIALTADAVAGAREHYMELGFSDYIAKPFSRDQIKEKLDIAFKETKIAAIVNNKEQVEKV